MSENTTIFLIRHGEVNNPNRIIYGRAVDVPLHQRGFEQIQSLAYQLKGQGVNPAVIYSSPLRRAVESAQTLAAAFPHAPVIKVPDLQDADHQGLETKTLDWLATIGGDVYQLSEYKETIEAPEPMAQRMINVVQTVSKHHAGDTVFVVSHGDPIAFARWKLLHPTKVIPSMVELSANGYLKKAETWRVVFDPKGAIIEHEIIDRVDAANNGVREY